MLILGLAFAVRGILFLLAWTDERRFYTLDAGGYLELARDLSAGYLERGSDLFALGLMRTPGYPLFAAAILALASSVRALVGVQLLVSVGTVWVCHRLGRRLVGSTAGAVAALFLALDPVSAIYANQLQPETLFTALLMGAVLAWVTALDKSTLPPAAAAGLLLGLAVLTRPIGAFLAVVLLAWGWILRNERATGIPMLSTIQGINLLEYRAAGAVASDSGLELDEARRRLRADLSSRVPPYANAAEVSRARTRLALEVMSAHPKGVVAGFLGGAFRLLTGSGLTALSRLRGEDDPESVDAPWKRAATALFAGELAVVYGCAAWGLAGLIRSGRGQAAVLLLGLVGYFVLISARPGSEHAVPLSGDALHRPPRRDRGERTDPGCASDARGAGLPTGVTNRAARVIGVGFVLAPWAPLKIGLIALAVIGLARSAARGARVPRHVVLLLAGSAFWLAHVASPYWLLPELPAARAGALALLVIVAGSWTYLAATEVAWQPQPLPTWAPAVVTIVLTVICFPGLAAPLEFRGDEATTPIVTTSISRSTGWTSWCERGRCGRHAPRTCDWARTSMPPGASSSSSCGRPGGRLAAP